MRKGLGIYALYKGDEYIDTGTKQYFVDKYGYSYNYMHFLASPVWKRRRKPTSPIAIKIGVTGHEEEFEDIEKHIPRID